MQMGRPSTSAEVTKVGWQSPAHIHGPVPLFDLCAQHSALASSC